MCDTDLSANTRKRYTTSFLQFVDVVENLFAAQNRSIEGVHVAEFGRRTLQDFVNFRLKDVEEEDSERTSGVVTMSTVNRDLTAIRLFFSFCVNMEWIPENPISGFKNLGGRAKLPPIYLPTDRDVARLCRGAQGTLHYFPEFLKETGGRVTETARVKWEDVTGLDNPVEGNVTLIFRETKGGTPRTITLRQQAIDILLQIPRSNWSPYIFWNNTEKGYHSQVSTTFWEIGASFNFRGRLHDLRHRFAIERLKEGWSVYRVQKYLGHRSVTTTEKYYFRELTQEQIRVVSGDGDNGF